MDQLREITAREANQRFASLLAEVERTGAGFIVTKRGKPVARILPLDTKLGLTPEQETALRRFLNRSWDLGIESLNRDELHER